MPGWRGTMGEVLISPPLEQLSGAWSVQWTGSDLSGQRNPWTLSIHSVLVATQVSLFLWVSDIVLEGIMVEGALLEMMVNLRLQVQERIPGRGYSIGKGLETRTVVRFRATVSIWYSWRVGAEGWAEGGLESLSKGIMNLVR